MSEHLDVEQLLALSLPGASSGAPAATRGHGQDPLAAARAHVAQCDHCAVRLREQQALFALLDQASPLPAVSPVLRARILGSVERAKKPASAWTKLAILAAVVSSIVLAYRDGRGSDLRLSDLVPHLGMHCLAFQGAFAAIPLVVGMALSRAGKVRLEPLTYSAWSMGFAVLGQVVLRTHCGAYNLSVHLFAVHFVGVLLAGVLAGGVGRALRPAHSG